MANAALLVLYSAALVSTLICGALIALSDYRRMKIPNGLSLAVAGCFVLAFAADHWLPGFAIFGPLRLHVLAGVLMFLVTYALFAFGTFGAGDSKVLTAFGFWVGLQGLPVFLFYVTIIGAVLALSAIGVRRLAVFPDMPEGSWLARVRAHEAVVPYGIAISLGAFVSFLYLGFFNPAIWFSVAP